MKKASLALFATLFAGAFAVSASAADIKPYVSEKIARSKIKIKDSATYPLPPSTNPASYGTNEKDSVLGSKTAIGFAIPVSVLRGSIRAEFEFGFNEKAGYDVENKALRGMFFDTKIKTQTYFINAYYDFDTRSAFTPYIGIGAGIANIKSRAFHDYGSGVVSGSDRSNNFVWNASVGGTYAFNKNLSLDVGYRYTDLGNLSGIVTSPGDAYKTKAKLSSHEVLAGIRYSF
jgi:opacity protein-like surface antigen